MILSTGNAFDRPTLSLFDRALAEPVQRVRMQKSPVKAERTEAQKQSERKYNASVKGKARSTRRFRQMLDEAQL